MPEPVPAPIRAMTARSAVLAFMALMALAVSSSRPAEAGIYTAIAGGYDCMELNNCTDADIQDAAHVSVRAGADFSFSNLVPGSNWLKPGILVGVEGFFNYSRRNINRLYAGATFSDGATSFVLEDYRFRARPEYQYGVSGRLGLQHRLGQIYGLGGYGWEPWTYDNGGFTITAKRSNQPDVSETFRFRDVFERLMMTGWHVGGGILLTPTRGLGVFVELRYSEMSGEFATKNVTPSFSRKLEYENYQVSAGLRFGF